MKIKYRFTSDKEPTDEQLQLLMQQVAAKARRKAEIADKVFWEQLQQLVHASKQQWTTLHPAAK